MSSRAPKLIATIVFFMLFLALSLYLTFPTEALKKRVESEIDNTTRTVDVGTDRTAERSSAIPDPSRRSPGDVSERPKL